jgi:MFS family permease
VSDPGEPGAPAADGLPRRLALLVAGAFFMENLDGTIISTAAPRIATSLHVAPVEINIAITAYLLAMAVLVPGSGWLADRYGSRRVFVAAVALFTLASAGCAASFSLRELVAMRVLQGMGGAMMVPVGRLVVLRATAKPDIIRAISYLTWPGLVAPVFAPVVGGLIVSHASWRWIFLLNVPLGLVALALAPRLVPEVRLRTTGFDWTGFALSAGAIAALVVAMEQVGVGPIRWPEVGLGLALAAILLALAVRHLLRAARPLLNLAILRLATLRVMAAGGSMSRAVISAVPLLATLMFQVGFGWTPVRSGLLVISLFVGNLAIKPVTTPLLHRFGFRAVLVAAVVGLVLSLLLCALIRPSTPLVVIALVLMVHGVFRSSSFAGYNSIAYADVGDRDLNDANTLVTTLQQLATGLGVALTALAIRAGAGLLGLAGRRSAASGAAPGGWSEYQVAFLLLAVLMACCLVGILRLPRTAGHQITHPDA